MVKSIGYEKSELNGLNDEENGDDLRRGCDVLSARGDDGSC